MKKQEMINEIDRMKQEIYRKLDFETRKAVNERFYELLTETKVNVTNSGKVRYYLTKNASKEKVENYLECLINAQYDVIRTCL